MVYRFTVSPNYSLHGFLNQSLSLFAVADFEPGTAPLQTKYPGLTHCYYKDQREPPGAPNEYVFNSYHTTVMMFRFMFVVAWENTVSLLTIFIKWFLGPMSTSLRERIEREEYITNEMIVVRERKRDSRMWIVLSIDIIIIFGFCLFQRSVKLRRGIRRLRNSKIGGE